MAGAYHASWAHEHQVLHMLGVLQSVGGCQVASQGVAHQHHLVDAYGLPPPVESCEEEALRIFSTLGIEGRSTCMKQGAETCSATS